MTTPRIKQPSHISNYPTVLISDFIIGGCLGAIVASILITVFGLHYWGGLIGIFCTVVGACLGLILHQIWPHTARLLEGLARAHRFFGTGAG